MIRNEIVRAMEAIHIDGTRFVMPDCDELLEIAEHCKQAGKEEVNIVDALTDAFYLGFFRGTHYRK